MTHTAVLFLFASFSNVNSVGLAVLHQLMGLWKCCPCNSSESALYDYVARLIVIYGGLAPFFGVQDLVPLAIRENGCFRNNESQEVKLIYKHNYLYCALSLLSKNFLSYMQKMLNKVFKLNCWVGKVSQDIRWENPQKVTVPVWQHSSATGKTNHLLLNTTMQVRHIV